MNAFSDPSMLRSRYIPVKGAEIYTREIGQKRQLFILHGGPDFDHSYLLPDMDRLADAYRLIYYDQRGRGRSAAGVQPEDVSVASEIADLEGLRKYFQLDSMALLGHSWGGLLAMQYALRYSRHVSHLILMNMAPVSHQDYLLLRQERQKNARADMQKLKASSQDIRYQEGDPDAVAAYYRIHFRAALRRPQHLDQVIQTLRASFTKEGILKARAIEQRLMLETWFSEEYNLIPQLKKLEVQTLVIHGDSDFIPFECIHPIIQAIPKARFVLLKECGHFSYLECPDQLRDAIDGFFQHR
jgi:proline iminopeptidase